MAQSSHENSPNFENANKRLQSPNPSLYVLLPPSPRVRKWDLSEVDSFIFIGKILIRLEPYPSGECSSPPVAATEWWHSPLLPGLSSPKRSSLIGCQNIRT